MSSPWGRKELDTTERLNWTELWVKESLKSYESMISHSFPEKVDKKSTLSWKVLE